MSPEEGWSKTQLGDVATLVKGISYESKDYCEAGEGAVFITIKCVSKAGGFKREGIKYFKGSIAASQELQPGELLIANTDLTRAGDIVGCPMVVPAMSGETITMSMDLSKLVEDDAKIDRDFLYYKLMTDSVRRFMKEHASGSTVLHLQTRAVPGLELEIPTSKPEQTKIAEILSTVDRAIEQTEALIAKQQRIKTGLSQDLLTRGIDEHGNLRSEQTHKFKDSLLGKIPVEWEVVSLGNVAEFVTSGSRGWARYYSADGATFLRIGNLTRNHINLRLDGLVYVNPPKTSEDKRTAVSTADLLISITADLGIIGVIPEEFGDAYVNQHIALVRLSPAKVHPRFIGWFLSSRGGEAQFDKLNESGAKAGLNLPTIRNLLIPITKLPEQELIAEILDSNTKKADDLSLRLNKIRSLKTALMQDLLTGQKRVTALIEETTKL